MAFFQRAEVVAKLCILLLAAGLMGCEGSNAFTKVVDVDLQQPERLPVLYADWSTGDSALYVIVTQTSGVLDNEVPQGIPNLEVEGFAAGTSFGIFEEQTDVMLTDRFSGSSIPGTGSVYMLRRPDLLVPGVQVALRVTGLPEGQELSAEGLFPAVTPLRFGTVTPPRFDTTFFGPNDFLVEQRDGEITFLIDDPAETEDYYQFFLRSELIDTARNRSVSGTNSLFGRDEDTRFQFVFRGSVFRDIVDNGSEISVRLDYFSSFGEGPSQFEQREFGFYEKLSPDTYNYLREREVQEVSVDNPFAEPIVLASNVEGGLGHFLLRSVSEETELP